MSHRVDILSFTLSSSSSSPVFDWGVLWHKLKLGVVRNRVQMQWTHRENVCLPNSRRHLYLSLILQPIIFGAEIAFFSVGLVSVATTHPTAYPDLASIKNYLPWVHIFYWVNKCFTPTPFLYVFFFPASALMPISVSGAGSTSLTKESKATYQVCLLLSHCFDSFELSFPVGHHHLDFLRTEGFSKTLDFQL